MTTNFTLPYLIMAWRIIALFLGDLKAPEGVISGKGEGLSEDETDGGGERRCCGSTCRAASLG